MELFDLYDEHNKPLGITKDRAQVHVDGDWHRVVHVYVVNSQGQYLVHLRSPKKDLAPECWDTRFGGHLQAGYDYDTTVIRELEEEIGLDVDIEDLIRGKIYSYDSGWNREHAQAYYYRYDGELNNLSFNDNEVERVEWMSPKEIIDSITNGPKKWAGKVEGFKEVYADYQALK